MPTLLTCSDSDTAGCEEKPLGNARVPLRLRVPIYVILPLSLRCKPALPRPWALGAEPQQPQFSWLQRVIGIEQLSKQISKNTEQTALNTEQTALNTRQVGRLLAMVGASRESQAVDKVAALEGSDYVQAKTIRGVRDLLDVLARSQPEDQRSRWTEQNTPALVAHLCQPTYLADLVRILSQRLGKCCTEELSPLLQLADSRAQGFAVSSSLQSLQALEQSTTTLWRESKKNTLPDESVKWAAPFFILLKTHYAAHSSEQLEEYLTATGSAAIPLLAARQGSLTETLQLDCQGRVLKANGSWTVEVGEVKASAPGFSTAIKQLRVRLRIMEDTLNAISQPVSALTGTAWICVPPAITAVTETEGILKLQSKAVQLRA